MPVDGFVIKGLVNELKQIENSKINQIHQPQKDTLTLKLYGRDGRKTLLLSTHPNYCRANLTDQSYTNPQSPSSFCMFLRKFLVGGKITKIEQYQGDRIVDIHIQRRDEFHMTEQYLLSCEIMGKHSNVILVNYKKNRIMDALKRIQRELSNQRELLPGTLFERPPAQDKLDPFNSNANFAQFKNFASQYQDHINNIFFDNFQGVSPFLSQQIIHLSGYSYDHNLEHLYDYWNKIINMVKASNYVPCIAYNGKDNKIHDVYWDTIFFTSDKYNKITYDTLNEAVEDFSYQSIRIQQTTQLRSQLSKVINKALKKARKKRAKQKREYENSETGTKYKVYGELLSANYHLLQQANSKEVSVYDFYKNPPQLVNIPIDTSKTPGENISAYFKKFKKTTNRIEKLGKEIKRTNKELEYLESLRFQIEEATNLEDLDNIRDEITDQGYLQKKQRDSKKETQNKETDYIRYYSQDGFLILVGKNNKQNDQLTTKKAGKFDIWLHTKEIAGSHVIIKGEKPPFTTIEEAAQAAAFHSKARDSENVPIDYTEVKNVRKPKGAKPGMVIYDNYKTLYVDPQQPKSH